VLVEQAVGVVEKVVVKVMVAFVDFVEVGEVVTHGEVHM